MKLFKLRNALGLSFAFLLAACGAGNQADVPNQTAALIQTNVGTSAQSTGAQSATAATQPATAAQVANAAMPAPDCAADGCKGPRIIDSNAEAFRYQAMKAAAPQS